MVKIFDLLRFLVMFAIRQRSTNWVCIWIYRTQDAMWAARIANPDFVNVRWLFSISNRPQSVSVRYGTVDSRLFHLCRFFEQKITIWTNIPDTEEMTLIFTISKPKMSSNRFSVLLDFVRTTRFNILFLFLVIWLNSRIISNFLFLQIWM